MNADENKVTIKAIKKVLPSSLYVWETGYRVRHKEFGFGRKKFVEGDIKTMAYWVTAGTTGLCKDRWTIRMWASRYHRIRMNNFYIYL